MPPVVSSSTPVPAAPFGVDTSPLDSRVSLGEVMHSTAPENPSGWQAGLWYAVFVIGFVIFGLVLLRDGVGLILAAMGLGLLTLLGVVTFSQARQIVRAARFAAAAGFNLHSAVRDPSLPGLIFRVGDERIMRRWLQRGPLELGEYECTTGSGRSRTTRRYGFVAYRLARRLPNMLLDAKVNNALGLTNLPEMYDSSQQLSLGVEADQHFNFYCPVGYQQDALYVFSPDVIAAVIDHGKIYDIELVDDTVYFYRTAGLDWSAAGMRQTLADVEAIITELGASTDHYADANIGNRAANVVAPAGVRLKTGIPWYLAVIFIVFIVDWIFFDFVLPILDIWF